MEAKVALSGPFLPLVSDHSLLGLVSSAKDYALSNGVVMRTKEVPESAESISYAPFMLFPSPVPRTCFEQAIAVQKNFNLLMHKVAHDHEFLEQCLKRTITVDEFTKNIWNVYETVRKEGNVKPVSLAMNRSDYMFDCKESEGGQYKFQLKQIEFNTMASSFGGLSQKITHLHRFILEETDNYDKLCNIPENTATDGLAKAVVSAWEQYGAETALSKKVKVIRRSIKDFGARGKLTNEKKLIIDDMEVAVVYQRSCYTPKDFEGQLDWDARLMLERSRAVVCPSAAYHLAGTKKVQQVLAQPGVVEKFISDPLAAQQIRDTFAHQYSLDMGKEGDTTVALAMKSPQQFVLKPQREGGGNNTFGDDIPVVLSKIKDSEERMAYILMQRIQPATLHNYPIMTGRGTELCTLCSELGIFGTLVGTKDNILVNDQQGHILRTKTVGTDEGGVATGYSALDSPCLI